MSWWAQTIANTLRLNDDEEPDNQPDPDPERGVKEDLSELTKTLSRQFWGVASFLSPPADVAEQTPSADVAEKSHDDVAGVSGLRSDLAEIGGRFRIGISKLSGNIVNTDFSKIASDLLLLGTENEEGERESDDVATVGVSEETVEFARGVAKRPETWLDFPVPLDDDDDEFELSDAQQDHALAVESLAPRLAALRIELCPEYMSESNFWMIYFVLLHPRLNEHDAELLSTPEIMEVRALLTQEIQNRTMGKSEENQTQRESYYSSDTNITPHEKHFSAPLNAQFESIALEVVSSEPGTSSINHRFATDKHPILSSEVPIVDKSVIEEKPVNRLKEQNINPGSSSKVDENSEDEADDWLKEEGSDTGGAGTTTVPIDNDEDVSFSDLEEDDGDASTSYKKVTYGSDSSTRESRDWVQLGRSSTDSTKDINTVGSEQVSAPNSDTKESSDWLDLEEIDVE